MEHFDLLVSILQAFEANDVSFRAASGEDLGGLAFPAENHGALILDLTKAYIAEKWEKWQLFCFAFFKIFEIV